MLITYVIVLLIAVVFRMLHFPGTSLLFLISPLFPLIDILVQSIRKGGDKETRILSSVGIFFISVFVLFKFLHWPGNQLWFCLGIVVLLIYLVRRFMKKISVNLRFVLVATLIVFSTFNFFLKSSSFTLAYLVEDPFNPAEPVPHFIVQRLAREFYVEGDFDKAEQLIQRNVDHLNVLVQQDNVTDYLRHIDQENLAITLSDLDQIRNRSWRIYRPLYREDRQVD
ncbi:MAG: hypothetical protein AB8B56_21135 [Crocinitomicaceae bacterium]